MAIYTGYFDEGSDEDQPYFVMGGIVLDADKIADFDKDWREAIKALPPFKDAPSHFKDVPFLHTADFVSGNGDYSPAWKGRYEEKLAILSSAARVISRHSFQTVTCSIYMDQYRALDSVAKMSEALGHPYTLLSILAYELLRRWANMSHILSPIKMVLEARDGIGDVIEMFKIKGYPVPAPEDKGPPQLQAADYLAWMRLKKYHPTSSFERVKDSWKEINKSLYIDQPFMLPHMLGTMADLAAQIDVPFPLREGDQPQITYNSDFKHPRKPFKKTALSRRTQSD